MRILIISLDYSLNFDNLKDPAINAEAKNYLPYENGVKSDIWIKWPSIDNPQKNELNKKGNNTYMLGYVWPRGKTVFPDFFLEKTHEWWKNEIMSYYSSTLTFDGLWIGIVIFNICNKIKFIVRKIFFHRYE